jgi:hypothetical protein
MIALVLLVLFVGTGCGATATNSTAVPPIGVTSSWNTVQLTIWFSRRYAQSEAKSVVQLIAGAVCPPLSSGNVWLAPLDSPLVSVSPYRNFYPLSVYMRGGGFFASNNPAGIPAGSLVSNITADPAYFQGIAVQPALTVRYLAATQASPATGPPFLAIFLPICAVALTALVVLIVFCACRKNKGIKSKPKPQAGQVPPEEELDSEERARREREVLLTNAARGAVSALPPHMRGGGGG